jgi:hypothetical protein
MAPDDAQQGVLADWQEQAPREALPWPSARVPADPPEIADRCCGLAPRLSRRSGTPRSAMPGEPR